jgi:hypothetical protein
LVGSRSKIINNTCKPNTQRMSASQDARVHYAVPKQQPRTPQPHTRHETFSMRCQGQDQTKPANHPPTSTTHHTKQQATPTQDQSGPLVQDPTVHQAHHNPRHHDTARSHPTRRPDVLEPHREPGSRETNSLIFHPEQDARQHQCRQHPESLTHPIPHADAENQMC